MVHRTIKKSKQKKITFSPRVENVLEKLFILNRLRLFRNAVGAIYLSGHPLSGAHFGSCHSPWLPACVQSSVRSYIPLPPFVRSFVRLTIYARRAKRSRGTRQESKIHLTHKFNAPLLPFQRVTSEFFSIKNPPVIAYVD